MTENNAGIGHGFYAAFLSMGAFVAADIYLNSTAEYEALESGLSQLQVVLLGTAIALQFSIASALFLIVCRTVPFRLGLWGALADPVFVRLLAVLAPMYFVCCIVIGGMRLVRKYHNRVSTPLQSISQRPRQPPSADIKNHIHARENLDVWRSWLYSTISSLHKIGRCLSNG